LIDTLSAFYAHPVTAHGSNFHGFQHTFRSVQFQFNNNTLEGDFRFTSSRQAAPRAGVYYATVQSY